MDTAIITSPNIDGSAYSMVICIKNESGKPIPKVPKQYKKYKHYSDIKIFINDQSKEFSFKEFAEKLGMTIE